MEINIAEENLIILQALNIKKDKFKDALYTRVENKPVMFNIVDNEKFELLNNDEKICEGNWQLIGQYCEMPANESEETVVDIQYEYYWRWGWDLVPNELSDRVKKHLDELPEHLSQLKKPHIMFNDIMLISYIHAYLMDTMKFDHVHIKKAGDRDIFTSFGLTNLNWLLGPDPVLEQKLTEEKLKRNKEYVKEENDAKPNWQNIFNLYKKIYENKNTPDLKSDLEQLKNDLKDLSTNQ